MKIRIWLSVIALTLTLGLYQNCSEVVFSENPVVYNLESVSFDTSDMLGAEYYKVVLVLDPSNSMNDDLAKLSKALDQVIETAKGYNIRFYVYNTDSNVRIRYNTNTLTAWQDTPSNTETLSLAKFELKDGSTLERSISNASLADWSSYDFNLKLKAPLAVFELTKNSTAQDIANAKNSLQSIVTRTYPVGVSSNEFGICTIRRILSESSDSRIIFPGDKVNFILISDENNGGIVTNDSYCSAGATVVRRESVLQDEICLHDYKGTSGNRSKVKAKNCDDNYNSTTLASTSQQMIIRPVLAIQERTVSFTFRHIDSIVNDNLPRIIDYNNEPVLATQTHCSQSELASVKERIRQRTGSPSDPLTCFSIVQNDGLTFPDGNFTVSRTNVSSNEHQSLVTQTFLGKHCNSNSVFFDSVNQKTYPSYKYAILARLQAKGITGVDVNKLTIASCQQSLSIEHLGDGAANPLAYVDNVEGSISLKYLSDVKTLANNVLGTENYIVSSFHHSVDLDQGLCSLNPLEATNGTNQNKLIASLGDNGYKQSICSNDYSQSLIDFAARFIKDQHRTFTLNNFRQGTEIMSILVNGREIVGLNNSFRLVGNRITISEGYLNKGDLIDVKFRFPTN